MAKLNRTMIGWAINYFCLGPVSNAYSAVENHACKKAASVSCVCQAQSDVGDQAVFEGLPTQRAGSSPP